MISVDEALQFVGQQARILSAQTFPLAGALGLRLAEDVASDVDSPPFDKSMVDGYAINLSDDSPTLRVAELVTAGHVPQQRIQRGATIQVMTGAPTPSGAQAVVKWEDCEQIDENSIRNPRDGVSDGYCIVARGSSFRDGQVVLRQGKRIGPLDIALLAEIDRASVRAIPRPRAAVLATGDELVEVGLELAVGQIRNSNGPMLLAALAEAAEPIDLGVARDVEDDLRDKLARGLECDVLLVSGGVSAGVKDLVPAVLADLGVEQVFHKVRMKPGKPLWFGVRKRAGGRTLVFGLPGNPVSTFVSYLLFVAPTLRALAGGKFASEATARGALTESVAHRGGRPTYHPCAFDDSTDPPGGVAPIKPLAWRGSSDLATLARADCLAVLAEGDYELSPGEEVEIIRV